MRLSFLVIKLAVGRVPAWRSIRKLVRILMHQLARGLLVAIFGVFLSSSVVAQSSQTGFPPFSSQAGGVNLSNLNVHLTIPVVHRSGRGIGFNLDLSYDSTLYAIGSNSPSGFPNVFTIPPAPDSISCLGCAPPPPFLGWGNSLGQGGILG